MQTDVNQYISVTSRRRQHCWPATRAAIPVRLLRATSQYAAVLCNILALAAAQSGSEAPASRGHGAQCGIQAAGAVCTSAQYLSHTCAVCNRAAGLKWPTPCVNSVRSLDLCSCKSMPSSIRHTPSRVVEVNTHLGPVLHMRGLRSCSDGHSAQQVCVYDLQGSCLYTVRRCHTGVWPWPHMLPMVS